MTVITKVSVGKKNKSRYNIFIDKGAGEEFGFSVSEEVLIKKGLKKGMTIDELDLMEISYQEDVQKAFSLSLLYLSHRMRSEEEINKYLKEKEYEEHVIKEVIHKLYLHKYLDDKEFAAALVRTRINAGEKGPTIIKQELKQKGIHDDVADEALLQYSDDLQMEHVIKGINKLAKNKKNISSVELKRKVEQTLIRKGFSSFIIGEALQEFEFEQTETDEWNSLIAIAERAHRRYSKFIGFEYEQKMKSALYRKGYPLELIEKFIKEKREETGD